MKKLFVISLMLISFSSFSQTIIKPLQNIIPVDTVTHELEFNNVLYPSSQTQFLTITISPTAIDTVFFTVAPTGLTYPIRSDAYPCTANENFIMSFLNGTYNLYYKSNASSGNSFTITY